MDVLLDPAGPIVVRDADGHTTVYSPGRWYGREWSATELSSLPAEAQDAAANHWTSARVAAYREAARLPVPTTEEMHAAINAERQRRIVAGKVIDGVYVTGRDQDARNLTNLALAAQLRMASGDTTTTTVFRDGQNVDHELTPPQMLALWQQSAAYVSALYAASWAIKAMDPMPADVTDDGLWPAG